MIKREDLIEGQVYKYMSDLILRYSNSLYHTCINTSNKTYKQKDHWVMTQKITAPTQEEIQWFEICEKAGKFIPKEEALKSKYLHWDTLVSGEIYVAEMPKNPEWNSVFVSQGGKEQIHRLYLNPSEFNNFDIGSWVVEDINFRHATQEEKDWINACIKANKLVPRDSLKSEEVFKEGSCIVLLSNNANDNCWRSQLPNNYCYKLSRDSFNDERGFNVEIDISENVGNGWTGPKGSHAYFKMRSATSEEIAEYDRLGKPYDVTTLKSKSEEWIPKAGDYIYVLPNGITSDALNFKNQVVEVNSYDICTSIHETYIQIEGGHSGLWFKHKTIPCEFRKATPEEIASVTKSIFLIKELEERKQELSEFQLPEYWCIKNDYKEVRDWFADYYKVPSIKSWTYSYIGYDECSGNNGVHGCYKGSFNKGNIEITIDQFIKYVLKASKVKEEPKQKEIMFKLNQSVIFKDELCRIIGFDKYYRDCIIEGYSRGHNGHSDEGYSYDHNGNKITIPRTSKGNRYYISISQLSTTSQIYQDDFKSEAQIALEKAAEELRKKDTPKPILDKNPFKVGDIIKVIATEASSSQWSGIGEVPIPFKVGGELEVQSIGTSYSSENHWITIKGDTTNHSYPVILFELVKQDNRIPKIDDWVVITKYQSGHAEGSVLRVVRVNPNYDIGVSDGRNTYSSGVGYYRKALPHEIPSHSSVRQYKEGDYVKIVSGRRPPGWNSDGKMDKYLGAIVKINNIYEHSFSINQNDPSEWNWNFNFPSDIERLATYEEVRDYQRYTTDISTPHKYLTPNPLDSPDILDYFTKKDQSKVLWEVPYEYDQSIIKLKASPIESNRIKVLQDDKPIAIKTPKEVPSKIKVL